MSDELETTDEGRRGEGFTYAEPISGYTIGGPYEGMELRRYRLFRRTPAGHKFLRGFKTYDEASDYARDDARIADPAYTPTEAEALRHPAAFVEGMEEL